VLSKLEKILKEASSFDAGAYLRNMAEVTKSQNSPVRRYIARQTTSFGDLRMSNEQYISSEFFCIDDPRKPTFRTKITAEFNCFDVYICPATQPFAFTKIKCDVFDDAETLRFSKEFFPHECRHSPEIGGYGLTVSRLKIPWLKVPWLKITVEIEYEGPSPTPVLNTSGPQSRQLDNLSKLFESGQHADVTFTAQEEKIVAHKCVLAAQSSYFERMFATNMKEGNSGEIKVTDVRPKIFRGILKYLYCGEAPEYSGADWMDLVAAADKYGLEELKKRGESVLCSQLNKENVIDALHFANRHGCAELLQQATNVFKMHY